MRRNKNLALAIQRILSRGDATSQEAIVSRLNMAGFDINQSKVSRLLRKLGAVKTTNQSGDVVYRLPKEPAPPSLDDHIARLIIDIKHNEQLIVIQTSPGSAQLIARVLDHHQNDWGILGSIAGDDTVLVIPKEIPQINALVEQLSTLLLT